MVAMREFRDSANRYAAYHLKAANKNGDKYLTKAEAAKLPKDLRDNFDEIQRADSNRQVTVKEFKTAWAAKVSTSSASADRNHDGLLTRDENRYLPNSLRDNLANYMNALEARGASSQLALQQSLASALTRGDWEAFKKLCDPANVEAQFSMQGMTNEQYVLESLGLGYVNGPFSDLSRSQVLDNIASVSFSSPARGRGEEPGDSAIDATVKLKSGRSAKVSIPVRTVGDRMIITPAYG